LASGWPLQVDFYFIASSAIEFNCCHHHFGGFGINHMSNPMPELVARISSYGTPYPSKNNNERLLLLGPVAHGTATAADAAGH
jgi:hypothetical protein